MKDLNNTLEEEQRLIICEQQKEINIYYEKAVAPKPKEEEKDE